MCPNIDSEQQEDFAAESVLRRAGTFLKSVISAALLPGLISSEDEVALVSPYQERQDFRLGIYLYDIKDFSAVTGPGAERISSSERRMPPKMMELRYVIFVNQLVPFGRMGGEEEAEFLEAAIRALYDAGRLLLHGNPVGVQFSFLPFSEKVTLWQSFSKQLQPAVYVTLSPVMIPSGRMKVVPEVKQVDYRYRDLSRFDG